MKAGKIIKIAAFLIAAVCILVMHLKYASGTDDTEKEEYRSVLLTFENADGTVTNVDAEAGSQVSFPEAAVFDGYTFLGWMDENGKMYSAKSVTAKGDMRFTTLYTVALNEKEHIPYIFLNEQGSYDLRRPITKADAAMMLYPLLSVEVESKGNYFDVPGEADYAAAAGALYQLQAVEGKRFRPDETMTRAELISLLCAFYPNTTEDYEFGDVFTEDIYYRDICTAVERGWIDYEPGAMMFPDEIITKLEAVKIINNVLGRTGPNEITEELCGLTNEVPDYDDDYAAVLEAALGHEYSTDGKTEKWLSHDDVVPREEGFVMSDRYLYYIDSRGMFLRDGSVNGFNFDSDGRFTTGNEELDEIIHNVLLETIDSDDMDIMDKLRAVFEYTRDSFKYQRRKVSYFNVSGWEEEEAYNMFTSGKGNCYSYAAVLYYLSRAIGIDANTAVGLIGGNQRPHGWVEIELDGVNYIFDAELEMAQEKERGRDIDLYMVDPKHAKSWRYVKVSGSAAS